ncbi:MAG: CDP-alcohol phosphatidyltransferase family protein [Rhodanobacteraceae bacterium]|nr:CDP-alcohol phosphatidyltransferase family protein [Rhodanobacteraceae bacterium]
MPDLSRSRLRHLPNALSVLRLLMALPIALLVVYDESVLAMALFITAGATDGIDGWLAKRYHWQSQLGGWLDPLADKALVLSVCVALTAHGDLPYWLLGLIAIRDLVIVSGAVAFHFNYAPLHAAPTIVGKITTAALLLLVVLLLWQNVQAQIPTWLIETLILACAGLLLVSGVDYVRRWSIKARRIGDRHS